MSLLRRLPCIVILILLRGLSLPGNAQIVNIENQRLSFSDTVRWRGNIQSSLFYKNYSSVFFNFDNRAYLSFRRKQNLWMLNGNYAMTRASGHDYENQYFLHLRYNRTMTKNLTGEVFSQIQQNKILGVRNRYLAGLGPRFECKRGFITLFIGSLYMYEYELATENSLPAWTKNRNSSYLSFCLKLNPAVSLVATNYYQPNLGNFHDYRIMGQYRLLVLMTKKLSLKIETNLLYDSQPVQGAVNNYSDLTFGAQLDF